MARRIAALALALGVLALGATRAAGATSPLTTPLQNGRTHRPLSCPDPSVVHAVRHRFDYFVFCTTDGAADAFSVYGSRNLVDWYPLDSVFPRGHQPAFALPTGVRGSHGRFWAPSINFIAGRWVLYFSAAYNPAAHALPAGTLWAGTMVLGVATSRALGGPWRASLLHYPGQLNGANALPDRERGGGDIDPAAVLDPLTGQRLLVWAEQRERIWIGGLSADGLTLGPLVQQAFGQSRPWECDPLDRDCTVEGPQPAFHDGRMFILFSGASTWDSSYAVGAASASNPFAPFTTNPQPILRSGGGLLGPGGVSDPVTAPDGQTVVLFHALTRPDPRHRSGERLLYAGPLTWGAGGEPSIDGGVP
jgi:hypothetical protein